MNDPLAPHRHDPNPEPPSADPTFVLGRPDGTEIEVGVSQLQDLPRTTVPDCYIVSTGHGTSGPFSFSGVLLRDFVVSLLDPGQLGSQIEVIGGDGFGTRVQFDELSLPGRSSLILVAYAIDGEDMFRQQGLVRLIVPSERDGALRQVKWITRINVLP